MPTYYTETLYNGDKETLRSFILRCALATGAGLRASKEDMPLPISAPPVLSGTNYYKRKLKATTEWLEYYKRAKENRVDLFAVYDEFRKNTEEKNKEEKERIDAIKSRYLEMKERIENFDMPSEYSDFKSFILKQLSDGIEYDCVYHETEIPPIEEWIDRQIENYQWEADYYAKEADLEEKQIEKDTAFLNNLYTMLDKVDPYKDNKNTK